jgi:hypothetical protein
MKELPLWRVRDLGWLLLPPPTFKAPYKQTPNAKKIIWHHTSQPTCYRWWGPSGANTPKTLVKPIIFEL